MNALEGASSGAGKLALDFQNMGLIGIRESDVIAAKVRVNMLDEAEFYKNRHCNGVWDANCQAGFNVAAENWTTGISQGETLQAVLLTGLGAGVVARSAITAAAEICGASNWVCIGGMVATEASEQALAEFAAGGFTVATIAGIKQLSYNEKIVGYYDETRHLGAPTREALDALTTAAPSVPGRVQSRVNLPIGDNSSGWAHVLYRHFNADRNASQFTISQSDLRSLLQSPEVVNTPIKKTILSADHGTLFVREVDLGRVIGTDKFSNFQSTSVMTIMTDRFGNLVTATPGTVR